MADDVGVFVFVEKLLCAAESNLVDIFIYFRSGHANAVIANGQGFFFGIDRYINTQIAQFTF